MVLILACVSTKSPDDSGLAAATEPYNPCGAALDNTPPTGAPSYDYRSGIWFLNPDAGLSCDGEQWLIRASVLSADAIDAETIALQVWDSLTGALLSEHAMVPPEDGETDWLLTLSPEAVGLPCGAPGRSFVALPSKGDQWAIPDGADFSYEGVDDSCLIGIPGSGELEFSLTCSMEPLPDAMWAYLLFPITGEAAGPYFMPRSDEYDAWSADFDLAALGYTTSDSINATVAMSACKDGALLGSYAF